MLDELTELAHLWEEPEATPTTQLYEAALADLSHLEQLLGHLASEPQRTQLDPEDLERCRHAGRLASGLGELLEQVQVTAGPQHV